MTDSEIKALAEEFAKNTVSKMFKAGSLTDAYYDVSFNARIEGFIAGYKAALSGTEVKDICSKCGAKYEDVLGIGVCGKCFYAAGTERVECYLPDWNGGGEYTGIPMKKVTLIVVNPSKS